MLKASIFLFGILPLIALGEFSNNPCFVEGQVCETTFEDNLMDILFDGETLEECGDFSDAYSNCSFGGTVEGLFEGKTDFIPIEKETNLKSTCFESGDCSFMFFWSNERKTNKSAWVLLNIIIH